MSFSPWLLCMGFALVPVVALLDAFGPFDVLLLGVFFISRNWVQVLQAAHVYDVHSLLGITGAAAIAFISSQVAFSLWRMTGPVKVLAPAGPRPLLLPCRTSHTRFFPKVHSFSYSYLFAGIPVGWQGTAGGMLSGDGGKLDSRDASWKSGWFSIDAAEYLDRGNGHLGLEGKLRAFLQSQGICHEVYQYAYLMTAPKFLGYSFNPVSFWYLYSASRELTAMVLEVNNTFDERHIYFLKPTGQETPLTDHLRQDEGISVKTSVQEDTPLVASSIKSTVKPTRFSNSWMKEFHVSPFNSRKGTYSLVTYDPLFPSMTGQGPVNNTITLNSSGGHSKLVARIVSEGSAMDPLNMTLFHKVRFLTSWWWVGFVTFPRIVREAGKLFFKRKLHVWFRPEPLKDSLGRHADRTEVALEAIFRDYLQHLVEAASSPLVVKYTAAGIKGASQETFSSLSAQGGLEGSEELEFKVLTPVFYSRFVHYAHDLEAFFCEYNESSTIWLSRAELLPKLVIKKPMKVQEAQSWSDYVFFKAIQKLRQRPSPIERPKSKKEVMTIDPRSISKKSDIRSFRLSAMDGFVLTRETSKTQKIYRQQVLKLFISDYVALGSLEMLGVELLFLRATLWWIVTGVFRGLVW